MAHHNCAVHRSCLASTTLRPLDCAWSSFLSCKNSVSRLMRRYRATLSRNVRRVLRDEVLDGPKASATLNVHLIPLAGDGAPQNFLIMFEITSSSRPEPASGRNAGSRAQARASHTCRRKNSVRNRGRSRRS